MHSNMSFSSHLWSSLNEGADFGTPFDRDYEINYNELDESFVDESGFDDGFYHEAENVFGQLKTDLPEKEGLENSVNALDQYVDATDGDADDVELSFHDMYEDESGFGKGVGQDTFSATKVEVDPATVPKKNLEDDQFEDSTDVEDYNGGISASDLADLDEDLMEESFTGWNDLF